jgi:hypothetical protein
VFNYPPFISEKLRDLVVLTNNKKQNTDEEQDIDEEQDNKKNQNNKLEKKIEQMKEELTKQNTEFKQQIKEELMKQNTEFKQQIKEELIKQNAEFKQQMECIIKYIEIKQNTNKEEKNNEKV